MAGFSKKINVMNVRFWTVQQQGGLVVIGVDQEGCHERPVLGQSGSLRLIVEMSTMRTIVDINAVEKDIEGISTLSEQNENSIENVSLIAHQRRRVRECSGAIQPVTLILISSKRWPQRAASCDGGAMALPKTKN